MTAPWRVVTDGLELAVRVTPRGGRDLLMAGTAEHLSVRLAAPPVDGAANAALQLLVARTLNVRRSAVVLIAGERARVKRLRIVGDGTALAERLASLYGTPA